MALGELMGALHRREPLTAKHCGAVARCARAISFRLGLPRADVASPTSPTSPTTTSTSTAAATPNGLAGEEISIHARIIAVADTFDAMTSRQSYRSPVSTAEAIAELRRAAGRPRSPSGRSAGWADYASAAAKTARSPSPMKQKRTSSIPVPSQASRTAPTAIGAASSTG